MLHYPGVDNGNVKTYKKEGRSGKRERAIRKESDTQTERDVNEQVNRFGEKMFEPSGRTKSQLLR